MKILSVALAAAVLVAGACHAKPMACRDEAGHETAAVYVRDCMLNSPATHPPCNDANPCWMIVGEVVRSCEISWHSRRARPQAVRALQGAAEALPGAGSLRAKCHARLEEFGRSPHLPSP